MPRFVVKLTDKKYQKDYFLLWSTITDSPLNQFTGLYEAVAYLNETPAPISEIQLSIESLMTTGISNTHYTMADIYDTNCDGIRSMKGLIARFVRKT